MTYQSVTDWFIESLLLMNDCVCFTDCNSLAVDFIQNENYSFDELFKILQSDFERYLESDVEIHLRAPILYQGFDSKLNYLEKLKEENKEVSTLRTRFLNRISQYEIQNSPLFGLLQEWMPRFNFSIYSEYLGKSELIGVENEEELQTNLLPISTPNNNMLKTTSYGYVLVLESDYEEKENYDYLMFTQCDLLQELCLNYMVGQYRDKEGKYFCQFYRSDEKNDFHLFFNYQGQTLENICVFLDGKEDRFTAKVDTNHSINSLYQNKQFPDGQAISIDVALSWIYESIRKNIPQDYPVYDEIEKFLPLIKNNKVKKQTLSN